MQIIINRKNTFPQKRADAFMWLIENSLQHNTGDMAPLSPPQHHQIIVHIQKDSLMHGAAHHCCRFPGCTESRFVDAHHIQHWCDGGETRLDNLVLLCRRHHRLVHEQGYEIINHVGKHCDGDTQQRSYIEFRRPDRQRLPESLYPQFAEHQAHEESLAIERQHQHMGLHIDQLTAITRWRGERLDYSMAMDAVIGSDALSRAAA